MSLYDRIVTEAIPSYSRDPRLIGWKPRRKATGRDAKDEARLNAALAPLKFSVQWMEVDPDFDLFGVMDGSGHGVGQIEWFKQGWEVDAERGVAAKIVKALKKAGEKVKGIK